MATKKQIIEELNFLSDIISQRCRTISTGIIAFCWLFILQNLTKNESPEVIKTSRLLIPISFAILSLTMDLLQYWIGFILARTQLNQLRKSVASSLVFDEDSFLFKLRSTTFYLKQFFVLVSVIWLFSLVLIRIFN